MNLQTITMPKSEARAKLKEYRRDLQRRASQQYEEIARGYAALAKGHKLIRLSKTIQAGGFFDDMKPRVAIAPADREQIWFRWSSHSRVGRFDSGSGFGRTSERLSIDVDLGRAHGQTHEGRWGIDVTGQTLVPLVPPAERNGKDLKKLYTLWEVEEWTNEPPRDPALLRHIGGDLYAVLAVWDLTELERAVLG